MENQREKAPWWLSHKPIVTVDYEENDAHAGDAKFLSIGQATWNAEDYSAKIWRWAEEGGRWSRQSEEMPLWRVIDLATLIIATINGKESNLGEFTQMPESLESLKSYLNENMEMFASRLNELSRLLSSKQAKESTVSLPNIFDFATSELSQDALFAWLIQWADPKYKGKDVSLFNLAQRFVRILLSDNNYPIHSINVGRQWKNIDVWVEINDDTSLVIEDKTNTSIHDDQLERYKKTVEEEYKGKRNKQYFAYVKTGNEPLATLQEIEKIGYRTISRKDIINCLEGYSGNDTIIPSYFQYLSDIESETESFRNLPVNDWGWYAWQGFYKELEKKLNLTKWDYVSNPAGGFLGAWWHFTPMTDGEMYLQFEEQKLCFKVYYDADGDRSEFRWKWFDRLISTAEKMGHPEIVRPARFGAGYYMTIAVVEPNHLFGDGKVDMEILIERLKEYQKVVDVCCKE